MSTTGAGSQAALDRAVRHLREVATLTTVTSPRSAMKARAFERAARSLGEVDELPGTDTTSLTSIPGIGSSAASIVQPALHGLVSERLAGLRESAGPAARALTEVRGIGAATAGAILAALNAQSMDDIRETVPAHSPSDLSTKHASALRDFFALQDAFGGVVTWHAYEVAQLISDQLATLGYEGAVTVDPPSIGETLGDDVTLASTVAVPVAEHRVACAEEVAFATGFAIHDVTSDGFRCATRGGRPLRVDLSGSATHHEAVKVQVVGDGHAHTALSGDGLHSLARMVDTAARQGLTWIAITEHAPNLPMNGVSLEDLHALQREARQLEQERGDIAILVGAELNIADDGTLDWPDDQLATLDWCVASIHGDFDMPADVQTARIIRAMQSPHVNVWGHPSGRRIARRRGASFDVDAVVSAARDTDTAIEINGSLQRLDADAGLLQAAVEAGVDLLLSSDAHHVAEIERNLQHAAAWARACDVPTERIRNLGAGADSRTWACRGR